MRSPGEPSERNHGAIGGLAHEGMRGELIMRYLSTTWLLAVLVVSTTACETTQTDSNRFKFVPTAGGDVEYLHVEGMGNEGVVILHGSVGTYEDAAPIIRRNMVKVADYIGSQTGMPVFALARPGYGRTRAATTEDPSKEDRKQKHINRVIEAIESLGRQYDLKKVNLVGFSGGGDVSSVIALQRPDLVNKAVLYGAQIDPVVQLRERKVRPLNLSDNAFETYGAKVLKTVSSRSDVDWRILYGKDDEVVPYRAGMVFAEDLKSRGFKVTSHIFDGVTHFDFFPTKSTAVVEAIVKELRND